MFILRGQNWWLCWACCGSVPMSLMQCYKRLRIFDCDVCCLWLTPDYGRCQCTGAALNQTRIGCDTGEPAVWQACDRAELVLNNFLGSITLPKYWTRHLPFPVSPSWSQSPLLFANGAVIAPYLLLSRLITHRCKLARIQIRQYTPPTCCK